MAAHLFSESGQMQEVSDIPNDIFQVLEGGEDEGAVKYLLGFGDERGEEGDDEDEEEDEDEEDGFHVGSPQNSISNSSSAVIQMGNNNISKGLETISKGIDPGSLTPQQVAARRRDTSGLKAIYACNSCGKAFTTKFNLKRHINMHCHRSKAAGIPIQGPPSANTPSKKPTTVVLPKSVTTTTTKLATPFPITANAAPSVLTYQVGTGASTATVQVVPLQSPSPTPSLNLSPSSFPAQPLPEASLKILKDLNGSIPVATTATLASSSSSTIAAATAVTSAASSRPLTLLTTLQAKPSSISSTSTTKTSSSSSTVIPPLPSNITVNISVPVSGSSTNVLPSAESLYMATSSAISSVLPVELFDKDDGDAATTKSIEFVVKPASEAQKQIRKIDSIPDGWVRKVVRIGKRDFKVFFYSQTGKKFSCHSEISQYFSRLGYAVNLGVFDFLPSLKEIEAVKAAETTSHPPPSMISQFK